MSPLRRATRWLVAVGALLVASVVTDAQTPAPVLFVAVRPDEGPAILAIIDPVSGKIMHRIPAGPDPHAVAPSADGRFVFVVNTNSHETGLPDGDSISVIDMAARKEVRRVPIGQGTAPHDVRVAAGKVFFTAQGWKSVGRYDPERNKIDWLLGLGESGAHSLCVSRDGNAIFATNGGSGTVSVADNVLKGPPAWKVTTLPAGEDTEGADVSPDGKEAWVANKNRTGGGVMIIDVATKTLKQTVELQTKHANRMRFTPDGKRVLLLDRGAEEILVLDAASRATLKRIKIPTEASEKPDTIRLWDVTVAADSSHAYATVSSGANAARYDAEGEVLRASAGDRSGSGNRSFIAVIDLSTLAVTGRFPIDVGADHISWVGTR